MLDGDASARDAAKLVEETSVESVEESARLSEAAMGKFNESQQSLNATEAAYDVDLTPFKEYLNVRIEAQQRALESDGRISIGTRRLLRRRTTRTTNSMRRRRRWRRRLRAIRLKRWKQRSKNASNSFDLHFPLIGRVWREAMLLSAVFGSNFQIAYTKTAMPKFGPM